MKVIREAYRQGDAWPHFVTLERDDGVRGYYLADIDALMELADEIDSTSCDKIDGELTVDLITIWGWAQAIREALEVSE